MAFSRPSLSDLITRISADYTSRLTGGGTLLRRSTVNVLARVHAGAMHLLYGYAAFIANQLMPDTATAEYLQRWANIWGVTRKTASPAQFNVVFTGTEGTVIPAGTQVGRSDGALYTTNAVATITGGMATVGVTASATGSLSSISGGETITITSPIAGVLSAGQAQGLSAISGVDQELDAALLARLLSRIQTPPNGGSLNDYVTWAIQVSGVTRAWAYASYYGQGTVGVTFMRDLDTNPIPNAAAVAQVQAYIDAIRPVTAIATVFAPIAAPINFSISGISDTTVRAAVIAQLKDLLTREAAPGGTILLSHLNESISAAQGEVDHILISPVANVTNPAGYISTLGTVTWS